MAIFFKRFLLGNTGQENVFYDILEQKNAFLGYKNKNFKRSKNWHPWFWSKNGHFSKLFFLGNIVKENVFHDILEHKKASLGFKNKKFLKSKNWYFSKGVNPWFWTKNGYVSKRFFFRQKRPGKCLWEYSRTKKLLSRLKKQEV